MKKVYNKLVRDKIPDIARKNNQTPKTRILSDEEYHESLVAKLKEEVAEFIADNNGEELADILEILHALARAIGTTPEDVEAIRKHKAEERGGFLKKIYLESVEE
ncbi:MAG TPA: nucleoside triphosphate pyrophosphohydrolase [Candidatus Saccharimonadales bacterium]|jgi:predicted house-cleaning noncanonical NTP pyrophosphatase (MazG superfamily)|nr:nucleoside triphosphate pyrophosphohydrolase [Candidatus Saccharimonadales bacterium]